VDNFLAAIRTRSPVRLLAILPVNDILPGNWGWAASVLRGTSHARHRRPVFLHSSPATFVHSPLHSSSRRGWRDRSMLSGRPRLPCHGQASARRRPPNFTISPPDQRRPATWAWPRSAPKRASHAPAVHEPQRRPWPGHRGAMGRTPPGADQPQPGYDPVALVATHLPTESTRQDHEGSHFSPGLEVTLPGQSL
jgi:hypothetical protein